jgi:probable non-F420 flavinoid oxidoreductase
MTASTDAGTAIGFHASHEQLPPSALLEAVQQAEAAGFAAAMCSDHFAPWSAQQGESGHAWVWLGAALQATRLPIGVVTAPVQRYHPAVIAQAIASLAEMYPGRFWAALGSGENLNEHITGDPWPAKPQRDARLLECAHVMSGLLAGEVVSHRGAVHVDRARLWSRPAVPPPLLGAAVGPGTAARVASWADGLITVNQPMPDLRATVKAFREHGGADKPVAVQVHLSWATTEDEALAIAFEQWRPGLVRPPRAWDLALPEEFEDETRGASPADIRDCVNVSADLGRHVAWIEELIDELHPAAIYLHHVGQEQAGFIRTFGDEVLPRCRR